VLCRCTFEAQEVPLQDDLRGFGALLALLLQLSRGSRVPFHGYGCHLQQPLAVKCRTVFGGAGGSSCCLAPPHCTTLLWCSLSGMIHASMHAVMHACAHACVPWLPICYGRVCMRVCWLPAESLDVCASPLGPRVAYHESGGVCSRESSCVSCAVDVVVAAAGPDCSHSLEYVPLPSRVVVQWVCVTPHHHDQDVSVGWKSFVSHFWWRSSTVP
jgi:hypothetical protein